MPNTYTQLYVQIVFPVKGRQNLLEKNLRERIFKYMSGIIEECEHKSIIVNGHSDHVHLFVGLNPKFAISDLVRDVKSNSSKFINDNNLVNGKFEWQQGYGAFTYAKSQIEAVYNYIKNQEEQHKKRGFKEEYLDFLEKFEIEYDEKYLFDFIT
ncbi:MAG: IS200/IS605 family transposase [Bacteroidia bacterium]